ncbi:MAG: hypothetical protein V8S96_05295 [Lachnospiraceae bacterium]
MVFGVLKDIKNGEYRVIATPSEVASGCCRRPSGACPEGGRRKGRIREAEYVAMGAELVDTAEEMYKRSDFSQRSGV